MAEVKCFEKRISDLYAGYSPAVQLYHAYDLRLKDYGSEDKNRIVRYSRMAKAIILFNMSEAEYEELQESLKGHIIQTRIQLASDWEFVRTIYESEK